MAGISSINSASGNSPVYGRRSPPTAPDETAYPRNCLVPNYRGHRGAIVGGRERYLRYRDGVAVHEVNVVVFCDAFEQSDRRSARASWFQPMCGTGSPARAAAAAATVPGGSRGTASGLPRSDSNSSCMPRQMPNTGCLSVGSSVGQTGSSQPLHRIGRRADAGQNDARRAACVLASVVTRVRAPNRSNANRSEARLAPPLSMMTAIHLQNTLGARQLVALATECLAQGAADALEAGFDHVMRVLTRDAD